MEWYSLLIVLIGLGLIYKFQPEKLNIVVIIIPLVVSALIIFITSLISNNNLMSDEEYRSSLIVKARYYEYWESWVVKECSRQVPCGEDCSTDSQGKRTCHTKYCTEYYDCSYYDHNYEYYQITDELNINHNVSKNEYLKLKSKWNSNPNFIELNRNIKYHYSCGVDGDAYEINWNPIDIHKTETYNWIGSFVNRTRLNKSAFNYQNKITDQIADSIGLYRYPTINYNDNNSQQYILGLDKLKIYNKQQIDSITNLYNHLNGHLGPRNKVHVFVLLFHNKSQDIALTQEAYWEGGNQNELVVCIGLDKNDNNVIKLQWVKSFSWTDNKKTLIDIRENIMEQDTLDFISYHNIIKSAIINDKYHYKNLDKDFEYLDADLSDNSVILIYILVTLINIGFVAFVLNNDNLI